MNRFSKITGILTIALIIGFTGNAFACEGYSCLGNDQTVGTGALNIGATSMGGDIDYGYKFINNGVGGGLSAAGGVSTGAAAGVNKNGTMNGSIDTVAGGVMKTTTFKYTPTSSDPSVTLKHADGVGSTSVATGVTGGNLKVSVDPTNKGAGVVAGGIDGIAGEVTVDGSIIKTTNKFDSDGVSDGVAGQGAVGEFEGTAGSGPDYKKYGFFGPTIDSNAGAEVDAYIEMSGYSESDSYRYIVKGDGNRTEVLGTNVMAGTNVITSGDKSSYDNGLGYADADICGDYKVAGVAISGTVQKSDSGLAIANAAGIYTGFGALNTSYTGTVVGGTSTSITTIDGMNGSIVHSSANMAVSSNVTRNAADIR